MKADALIRLRFKLKAEGGKSQPIGGGAVPFYAAPLIIDGEAFDCRVLLGDRILVPGETYELPVKFMNADAALGRLVPGKRVSLWEAGEIADGEFLAIVE